MACLSSLTSGDIVEIFEKIQSRGYCRLDGFVSPDWLSAATLEAETLVSGNADQSVSIIGQQGLTSPLLNGLHTNPAFIRLCSSLYQAALDAPPAAEDFHQVLRCLKGSSGRAHSKYLHFDSYVVSVLVPITIPRAGGGDLMLLPARRRMKQPYLINVVQKLMLGCKPAQSLLWWAIRRQLVRAVRIRLQPGSIYFFLGHTSIHANEACRPEELRATVLYHFGNPHAASSVRAWMGRLRSGLLAASRSAIKRPGVGCSQ